MKKSTLCAISAAVLSFALANTGLMAQRPAPRPAQGRPAASHHQAKPAPAPHHHAKPAPAPHHHAKPAPPPHHHGRPAPPPHHPHHHHYPTTWGDLIGDIIDAAIHESRH